MVKGLLLPWSSRFRIEISPAVAQNPPVPREKQKKKKKKKKNQKNKQSKEDKTGSSLHGSEVNKPN